MNSKTLTALHDLSINNLGNMEYGAFIKKHGKRAFNTLLKQNLVRLTQESRLSEQ